MITYFSCVFLRKDLFVSVGNCIDIVNVILKIAIMIGIYIILCYFLQILDPLIFVTMFLQELSCLCDALTRSKRGEAIRIK